MLCLVFLERGRGELIKIDISRAFRHLRVDPADIDLLGLQVDQHHFVDVSMLFRYRNGSLFFQHQSWVP